MPSKPIHLETACSDCGLVYRHRHDVRSGRCKSCRCKHAAARKKDTPPMTPSEIEEHLEAGDRKTWNLGPRW